MKLFYKISLFSLLTILFCGCLEVETTINLNKDGSGTLEEKVLMKKEFVDMMSGFNLKSENDTAQTKRFSLFNPEELKADALKYGENVEYVSGKEIVEKGKEGYKAVYKFKNINQLKIDNDPSSKVSLADSSNQNKPKEFITFSFAGSNPSELTINMPKAKFNDSSETIIENKDTLNANNTVQDEFLKFMKDFRFALQLHVNGKIKSTNASYVKGSNITLYNVEFDKLLENKKEVDKLNNFKSQDIDEMKKILEKIPGIKIELKEAVKVKFD